MTTLVDLYSTDEELLREVSAAIGGLVAAAEEPALVDEPGSLDLDVGSLGAQLWQIAVAFGGLKASIEAVTLIAQAVLRRGHKGVDAEVELALPQGIKVKFSGRMTAEQAAAEVERFTRALRNVDPGTP